MSSLLSKILGRPTPPPPQDRIGNALQNLQGFRPVTDYYEPRVRRQEEEEDDRKDQVFFGTTIGANNYAALRIDIGGGVADRLGWKPRDRVHLFVHEEESVLFLEKGGDEARLTLQHLGRKYDEGRIEVSATLKDGMGIALIPLKSMPVRFRIHTHEGQAYLAIEIPEEVRGA